MLTRVKPKVEPRMSQVAQKRPQSKLKEAMSSTQICNILADVAQRPITQVYGLKSSQTATKNRVNALKSDLSTKSKNGNELPSNVAQTRQDSEANVLEQLKAEEHSSTATKRRKGDKDTVVFETRSVWIDYRRDYDVRFGETWLSMASTLSNVPVMIVQHEHAGKDAAHLARLLSNLAARTEFVQCLGGFASDNGLSLVLQLMDRSLTTPSLCDTTIAVRRRGPSHVGVMNMAMRWSCLINTESLFFSFRFYTL